MTARAAHDPERPGDTAPTIACTFCGAPTERDVGRLTVWYGDDLVVVEGVPARTCTGCGETFYDDDAVARMERLVAGGAERPAPARTIEAAVYAWDDI